MLGFDHSVKTDADVFKDTSFWLTLLYQADKRLNGIIHLYPIHNTRISGTSLRDSRVFWALCGDDDLRHVILVTSFWDRVDVSAERPSWLRSTGGMLLQGARMKRFQAQDSALSIVMSLVNHTPRGLSIQRELLEQNKSLDETTAGKVIRELLREGRQGLEQYQRREQERIREKGR